MEKNLMKNVAGDKFAAFIGAEITEIEVGHAVAKMKVEEHHCNGVGVAHGGAIFALADYAFAAACNAEGIMTLAVNVSISYFQAGKLGSVLTAVADEISSSRKLATYQVDILNEDGELVSRFSGTGYRKG